MKRLFSAILIVISTAALLCSCNFTKKTQSMYHDAKDSSGVEAKQIDEGLTYDSTGMSHVEATAVNEEYDENTSIIEIELDPRQNNGNLAGPMIIESGSIITADPGSGLGNPMTNADSSWIGGTGITTAGTNIRWITGNGNFITGPGFQLQVPANTKSVRIIDKSRKGKKDSSSLIATDSGRKLITATTSTKEYKAGTVHEETTIKQSSKTSWRLGLWGWVCLTAAGLLVLWILWRRFKRRLLPDPVPTFKPKL